MVRTSTRRRTVSRLNAAFLAHVIRRRSRRCARAIKVSSADQEMLRDAPATAGASALRGLVAGDGYRCRRQTVAVTQIWRRTFGYGNDRAATLVMGLPAGPSSG